MAQQVTRVCDWKDDLPDSIVCGRPASTDVTVHISGITLSGDLCTEHREEGIERLRRVWGLSVDHVRVDSKPRATYVTASGRIVATRDIRAWALAEGRIKSSHGRLAKDLIEEYLLAN